MFRTVVAIAFALSVGLVQAQTAGLPTKPDLSQVPGVVIDHSPATSGIYLGSPGLAVLPDGRYLAKCDEFGPGSTEGTEAITRVYRSADHGRTWKSLAKIPGLFWASIFYHREAVYLLGTDKANGNTVIRKSLDSGETWSTPRDPRTGVLRSDARYHCAPVPVVVHRGRLWRGMEDTMGPDGWGHHFRALMMSAPEDADLLDADNWIGSDRLGWNPAWLDGQFGGWLEGNAVVTPEGQVVDILRVDYRAAQEQAAILVISEDGRRARFDAATGFVPFPGGCKKFTIRFDPLSKCYWTLSNYVPEWQPTRNPERARNTLALIASSDLRSWEIRSVVLHHPDSETHAFQYVDWLFEGDDLIAVSRTAYDDGMGGAHNQHDANLLTFHRIQRFRERTMAEAPSSFTSRGPKSSSAGTGTSKAATPQP